MYLVHVSVLELKFVKPSHSPLRRHARERGQPEAFDFPGFRVALAIASLPGTTFENIQRT